MSTQTLLQGTNNIKKNRAEYLHFFVTPLLLEQLMNKYGWNIWGLGKRIHETMLHMYGVTFSYQYWQSLIRNKIGCSSNVMVLLLALLRVNPDHECWCRYFTPLIPHANIDGNLPFARAIKGLASHQKFAQMKHDGVIPYKRPSLAFEMRKGDAAYEQNDRDFEGL